VCEKGKGRESAREEFLCVRERKTKSEGKCVYERGKVRVCVYEREEK
jgi:hypothetical protein